MVVYIYVEFTKSLLENKGLYNFTRYDWKEIVK